ncbi:MAG: hypothetical protein COT71_04195 [Candidatus Andersenbacteria bacterium CG10_big_fil_rev_8_21_14_0_10_54_11]|uniref:Uncharacterized protein n=1 Tax=Candidatus Andersenbacteria bacterium CG10_big_fil_rev_8_21_14_0_10_54_11 TaxID=1974485 RepID=A0A2M6WYD9_9BACT|nr:MAG: hypothetical protein COT71_04195 [Candidatus Andersenbacteria bacterium CG10_big_fil_rev_8_21_14_0_10_54_11]
MAAAVAVWLSLLSPAAVLAQEALDAAGNPTGAPANTGAPTCTGAGCGQGADQGTNQGTAQGVNQGTQQGGPTLQDLGATQNENGEWVLPEGVANTTQGAQQGTIQGVKAGVSASNTGTGANSTNTAAVSADASNTTAVNNTAADTTAATAAANTGANTQNNNTGAAGVTTGNASIGVTQVKNDNTATVNGSSGLSVTGHTGNQDGDLLLGFGSQQGQLTGPNGGSVRAVNDTTGSGSTNDVTVQTKTESVTEVQNDGVIENLLNLAAITGQNQAHMNTGSGEITTGNANIAATLVNLLNTTVINGDLWVAVADIFGDLNGNIILPELQQLAAALHAAAGTQVTASNEQTGADSTNTIDVDLVQREKTAVANNADIDTKVTADAITGQNEASKNTGGSAIATGDALVTASNISVANTTVEGGNWGLVIVNALNRWLGFLVGDNGEVRALSQEETIKQIEAQNQATGSGSENTIAVSDEQVRETTVTNDARILNTVTAQAITGQNEASLNTGQGHIQTGNANVAATAVNIANTTVKDGSLFIAVVNIFGDWLGDLLYGGQSLAAASAGSAGTGNGGGTVQVDATNAATGANSTNTVDVEVTRERETQIDNTAAVSTLLTAKVDTGGNKTNKNTLGADITTGNGTLALHAGTAANLTGVALDPALGLTVTGANDTTGFDSHNMIRAVLNDTRILDINNLALVSTIFGGGANTGNNEANQNTVGGNIATGNVAAAVGVHNLVNRVMLALAGGGGAGVDADFLNRLTGALSDNSSLADVNYNFLKNLTNDALLSTLIDLLFNTGGNTANENTVGGNLSTGAVCFDGALSNDVNGNTYAGGLYGAVVDNHAVIDTSAALAATTGNNQQTNNTAHQGAAVDSGNCGKLAAAVESPTPTPIPSTPTPPSGGGSIETPTGVGGGGETSGEDQSNTVDERTQLPHRSGRVAGAAAPLLTRFPVAGDIGSAVWLAGRAPRPVWPLFLFFSVALVAVARYFDTAARRSAELRSANAAASV